MAVKKIKFNLPGSGVIETELEETVALNSFIHTLKTEKHISANADYIVKNLNGDIVDGHKTISSVFGNEFNIVDANNVGDEGFVVGKVTTSQLFHQLGIFVLDGSGSMTDKAAGGLTKGEAVNEAIRGLLTRFKISKNKNDFSFAVVTFDHEAKLKTPITSAVDIDDNDNYDPLHLHGGGTDIMTGLEVAYQLAKAHIQQNQEGGAPHSVVILLMTDGEDGNTNGTIQKVEEIKNGPYSGQITFCTTYFGQPNKTNSIAENHLKNIATDRVMGFKTVYNADTLRKFFTSSISAVSGVKVD